MDRTPASQRTREKLKALMAGRSEAEEGCSELVRLAARLIIEEALEGKARDALGRDYYARGAPPGAGYRNGYRRGRVKSAEGAIEYSTPQIAARGEPFRSRIRELVRCRTGRAGDPEPHRGQRGHRVNICVHLASRQAGLSFKTPVFAHPARTVKRRSDAARLGGLPGPNR